MFVEFGIKELFQITALGLSMGLLIGCGTQAATGTAVPDESSTPTSPLDHSQNNEASPNSDLDETSAPDDSGIKNPTCARTRHVARSRTSQETPCFCDVPPFASSCPTLRNLSLHASSDKPSLWQLRTTFFSNPISAARKFIAKTKT